MNRLIDVDGVARDNSMLNSRLFNGVRLLVGMERRSPDFLCADLAIRSALRRSRGRHVVVGRMMGRVEWR